MLPTSRDVPTAGWGHTGPDVKLGVAYPLAQRQTWFAQDLKWACDTVEEHCTVPLTDNQFAALVSICFNIGAANFDRSTLLKDLNASDTTDAAAQFLVWDKQRGVKLAGLDRRRAAEKALFETP
jgi:lysozyme